MIRGKNNEEEEEGERECERDQKRKTIQCIVLDISSRYTWQALAAI